MQTYTWSQGKITPGIATRDGHRGGRVVFLGEAGRGRRWEEVGLCRKDPAQADEKGVVRDATPIEIRIPARNGKPETTFFVLARPRTEEESVLVRVSTLTSYVRGARGLWKTVEGNPRTLVQGHGAFGDAGRVGTWWDGLVVMRPGDVLRVHPSRGGASAIWLEEGQPRTALWRDYETIRATKDQDREVLFESLPAFTFFGGEVKEGIEVSDGKAGKAILLGESGRGRSRTEVPILDEELIVEGRDMRGYPTPMTVKEAAVIKLDQTKDRLICGLAKSSRSGQGFLVRVSTKGPYTKNTTGEVVFWKGAPQSLTEGHGAHGDAGYVGGWSDELCVLNEGDVLYVRQEGGRKSAGPWALLVKDGELRVEPWTAWKRSDAAIDPDHYVAHGMCLPRHAPAAWVGRVVSTWFFETLSGGRLFKQSTGRIGELLEPGQDGSVKLNLGWDGGDLCPVDVPCGWVELEPDKEVRRLSGQEAGDRKAYLEEVKDLRERLIRVRKYAEGEREIDEAWRCLNDHPEALPLGKPRDGWDIVLPNTLHDWVRKARILTKNLEEREQKMAQVEDLVKEGKVLKDFGGWVRSSGNSKLVDYWVVDAEGFLRRPDNNFRGKTWKLVEAEEMALEWRKDSLAEPHRFLVWQLPASGCTPEQRACVEEVLGRLSKGGPPLQGWDLTPEGEPDPDPPAPPEAPADFAGSLAALKAKFG